MRRILIACLSIAVISLAGCMSYVTPFANTVEIDDVDLGSEFKEGKSCGWIVLFWFGPFGDMSVVKAAQDGGIRKAEIIDYRITNYILAQEACAWVYGK
jgi:hypothetical protein